MLSIYFEKVLMHCIFMKAILITAPKVVNTSTQLMKSIQDILEIWEILLLEELEMVLHRQSSESKLQTQPL